MRALALASLAAALASCAPRVGEGAALHAEEVTVGGATVRVLHEADDADSARRVLAAAERALPVAQRWGALHTPVVVTLHPDHEALEQAVHREGYDWLRAWARYATIDLQSPRSWSGAWSLFGPDQREIDELVLHELTHCAMYQAAASSWSWSLKEIPLWFREGMASYNARQAYRWKSVEEVSRFYAGVPGSGGGAGAPDGRVRHVADPLGAPEALYQSESHVVYGTAHLAFQFLVERYGDDAVRRLLGRMGEGHLFGASFEQAIGISPEQFEAEFRRYVAWGGWRGSKPP